MAENARNGAAEQKTNGNGNGARKLITIIFLIVAVILSAIYGARWFKHRLDFTVTNDAQVDAEMLTISSKVPGRIVNISVAEGDTVRKGQVIAQIEKTDFALALERAEAGLDAAGRELEKAGSSQSLTDVSTNVGILQSQSSLSSVQGGVMISSTQRDVNLSNLIKQIDLAKLGVQRERVNVQRAQVNVKRASERGNEVRTLADQALTDLNRAESLYKSGVSSKMQLDQARTNASAAGDRLAQVEQDKDDALKQLDVAYKQLELAEKQLEVARNNLNSGKIDAEKVSIASNDSRKAGLALNLSRKQREEGLRSADISVRALAAKVRDMEAAREQARLALEETDIKSPVSGIIAKKVSSRMEIVPSGKPIFFIIDTSKKWIVANIEETALEHLRLGAEASVTVDAIPGKTFKGRLGMIGAASNSKFALIPMSNPSGQFIKVTQRIPVKVYLDGDLTELKPGMNVVVSIKNQ